MDKGNGILGTDFKQAKWFDEKNVHAMSDQMKKEQACCRFIWV
jgi:hypothetical protein